GIAGDLMNLLREVGRFREALALSDQKIELTRQAGLGPWTQLADEARRLQIRFLLGEPEQVLTEVHQLLDRMSQLPDQPADNETVQPWNVRETILNLGVHAAQTLDRWQETLDLNIKRVASQRSRRAGDHDIAST